MEIHETNGGPVSLVVSLDRGEFFRPKDTEYKETPKKTIFIWLAVVAVLLVAVIVFFVLQANSFSLMLQNAGLQTDHVTYILKQGVTEGPIERRNRVYTVFLAETKPGVVPALVYAEKNYWGFWYIEEIVIAENEGDSVSIYWTNQAFHKRFDLNSEPIFEWEVQRAYCGSNAIKLIEIDPEQLPPNTAINIQQSGNIYRIHTVSYVSGETTPTIDFEAILRENGCIE